MANVKVGLIGGTGMEEALLGQITGHKREVDTPFGKPSAPIVEGEIDGVPIAILARHGIGHRYNPTQVPYRANIFSLKKLGVTHILASGAVGALREHLRARTLVVPHQVIDKTTRRASSFYEDHCTVHVEFADPFCEELRNILVTSGSGLDTIVHNGGTYVCMEGPAFSSRAEAFMHRHWGGDLIGMTGMPEAKLAREAEICYAHVSLITDFDCWRPPVLTGPRETVLEAVIANLQVTTQYCLDLFRRAIRRIASETPTDCPCQSALKMAIWSDHAAISPESRKILAPLIGKYVS